jgi:hypothetical protein
MTQVCSRLLVVALAAGCAHATPAGPVPPPSRSPSDDGKFILLVRRAPGGPWKIAADMDNGNRPR